MLTRIIQSSLCQMQHSTWRRSLCFASLTAPKLITASRWRTSVQCKRWHSVLPAKPLPTERLHKISADLFLPFQDSCSITRTHFRANQCDQYWDDIGSAANFPTHLTGNIRAVSQYNRLAGLKLTSEKYHYGVRQIEFLGRTISSEGISSPQAYRIQNFLNKVTFPKT